ncbi:MAG: HAD family phosphatase [SAR324 cluster bacterium]|uniref:HAD family phosphatase n=1 Tax=SAR324 cluster bacterium TaxID=2024889 RepID=A0A7X9FUU0_9DELT|nr:HAD family phosphatase [SAR324 cluster bacterium]
MAKLSLQAIFWDNDGVLVDTEILYMKATKEVLSKNGVELTEDLYREHFLKKSSGLSSLLPNYAHQAISKLRQERNEIYSRYLSTENVLIAGVSEVLNELYGRYKMGIISSSRRDHFDIIHSRTDILRFFDFILTEGDYDFAKPHPAPYLKALNIVNLPPRNCLAIEDSFRGLSAAKAAGIPCCLVRSPFIKDPSILMPDFTLNSIRDLPQLVRENYNWYQYSEEKNSIGF